MALIKAFEMSKKITGEIPIYTVCDSATSPGGGWGQQSNTQFRLLEYQAAILSRNII